MASFDIGAWNIPHDQVPMIHRGEMVATPSQAAAIRSVPGLLAGMSGDGGGRGVSVHPSTHFHVNAIDGAGMAQWVRANGSDLAKGMHDAARHGALLGLRRLNR